MIGSTFDELFRNAEPGFSISASDDEFLNAADLSRRVIAVASQLSRINCQCVALYADNGADWIVSDLACQLAGVRVVPLPLFFSDEQLRSAIHDGGVDVLLTDQGNRLASLLSQTGEVQEVAAGGKMKVFALAANTEAKVPKGTSKITFTSGTTGTPKGVCLSATQQLTVARSLIKAVGLERPRHLCLLPFSTLLENIAGVYAPLLAGGQVIAPSLAQLGLTGSSGLNARRLLENISHYQPHSIIVVPELLQALTAAAETGWTPPASLKFVAVGGGKTSPSLLGQAAGLGLPVYEGYGLSECASVVSLNRPGTNAAGTVGQPLEHIELNIENGEIVVDGPAFLGYAGQPESWYPRRIHTGDLGHIDGRGCLNIDGRKKNLLITSFGRNISPEWVESELLSSGLLQQAVVFGDAQAYCVALVSPRDLAVTDSQIDTWIGEVNAGLPDYARIAMWHRMTDSPTCANGLLTENGRPRRDRIAERFSEILTDMFDRPQEALAR